MKRLKLAFVLMNLLLILNPFGLIAQKKSVKDFIKPKDETLDKMFTEEVNMLEITPEAFEKEWKTFKWMQKDKKTGARYHSVHNMDRLQLFGKHIWESVARFKDGKFEKIEVSFYNRGDAESSVERTKSGNKSRALKGPEFKKLIQELNSKVNDLLKVKGKSLPPMKLTGSSNNKLYEKWWVKDDQCVGLEWNVKDDDGKIYPEFMKLVYMKYDPNNDPRRRTTRMKNTGKLTSKHRLKDNVVEKEEGDDEFTYIDNIPMVDQGPKGYCAAAATTRILKYYGSELDMHQVGALIKVTAGGTDPVVMLKQLKKAIPKLGTKVYSYMDPPEFGMHYSGDTKKYIRDIKNFNRMLERKNMSPVPMAYPIIASASRGERLELYKEFMTKKKRAYFTKFKNNIEKNIKKGIPVAWGLFLGFVKEDGKAPQSMGGHMRLIIGHNEDMSKLVFTDTWGAGHEYKTIDTEDAWAVTCFYGILMPLK